MLCASRACGSLDCNRIHKNTVSNEQPCYVQVGWGSHGNLGCMKTCQGMVDLLRVSFTLTAL